jgi:hypothetical protein
MAGIGDGLGGIFICQVPNIPLLSFLCQYMIKSILTHPKTKSQKQGGCVSFELIQMLKYLPRIQYPCDVIPKSLDLGVIVTCQFNYRWRYIL